MMRIHSAPATIVVVSIGGVEVVGFSYFKEADGGQKNLLALPALRAHLRRQGNQ